MLILPFNVFSNNMVYLLYPSPGLWFSKQDVAAA